MARKHTDTPPYVPKKGLVAVLDQIQGHKKGDLVTRDELHKRGVSAHLIYPAMAALRFLGLLDQTDHLLGGHEIFNREKPDREAQKKLVTAAYGDFFDNAPIPFPDGNALEKHFQEVYDLSERLMNSAFPLFHYLAEESGIALTNGHAHHAKRESAARRASDEAGHGHKADHIEEEHHGDDDPSARQRQAGVQINVSIQVNKYTTEKDIMRMVKTAKKAVHLLKKSGDSHY